MERYSVIQYSNDRGECVNIGLVMTGLEKFKARITPTTEKEQALGRLPGNLQRGKDTLIAELTSGKLRLQDHLCMLHATCHGWFKFTFPEETDEDFDDLYTTYVGSK